MSTNYIASNLDEKLQQNLLSNLAEETCEQATAAGFLFVLRINGNKLPKI
jgi:hypothetical protein